MRFSIIHKLKAKYEVNSSVDCNKHNITEIPSQNDSSEDTRPRIWLRIPFIGKQGELLVKKLFKKIQRNLIQPVKFVIYDTKKISYFLPKKTKFLMLRVAILFKRIYLSWLQQVLYRQNRKKFGYPIVGTLRSIKKFDF